MIYTSWYDLDWFHSFIYINIFVTQLSQYTYDARHVCFIEQTPSAIPKQILSTSNFKLHEREASAWRSQFLKYVQTFEKIWQPSKLFSS